MSIQAYLSKVHVSQYARETLLLCHVTMIANSIKRDRVINKQKKQYLYLNKFKEIIAPFDIPFP